MSLSSQIGGYTPFWPPAQRQAGWPGGTALPVRAVTPPVAPNETGCKVARLHNTCIYSVASHSWSLKSHHSLNHVLCHPEFLRPPQIQIWPPRWPPETAAARNAHASARRTRAIFWQLAHCVQMTLTLCNQRV